MIAEKRKLFFSFFLSWEAAAGQSKNLCVQEVTKQSAAGCRSFLYKV